MRTDLLERRVDTLLRKARGPGLDAARDREIAEEVCLNWRPQRSWRDCPKPRLVCYPSDPKQRTTLASDSTDEADFGWGRGKDAVRVYEAGRGARYVADLRDREERRSSTDPTSHCVLQALLRAAETRRHISRSSIAEFERQFIRFERAVPAAAFLHGDRECAVWFARAGLLLPTGRARLTARQSAPVLWVELDECVQLSTNDHEQALLDAAQVNFLCGLVRSGLESLAQNEFDNSVGHWPDDGLELIPSDVVVRLPPGCDRQAAALFERLTSALDAPEGERSDWWDSEIGEVLSIDVAAWGRAEHAARVDAAQKDAAVADAARHGREQAKARLKPGEEFLLLQFDDVGLCVGSDGLLYLSAWYDRLDDMNRELGATPEQVLQQCQFNSEDRQAAREWHQCERLLKKHSSALLDLLGDDAEMAEWCLREALQLDRLPGKVPKQPPVLRLLVDVATGAPFAQLAVREASLLPFLGAATTPDAPAFGATPTRLRVAKSLLQRQPEIASWCQRAAASLIHPASGFDAGVHHAKTWRDAVRSFLTERTEHWWYGLTGSPTTDLNAWINEHCQVLQAGAEFTAGHWSGWARVDQARFAQWRERRARTP